MASQKKAASIADLVLSEVAVRSRGDARKIALVSGARALASTEQGDGAATQHLVLLPSPARRISVPAVTHSHGRSQPRQVQDGARLAASPFAVRHALPHGVSALMSAFSCSAASPLDAVSIAPI